jgi:Xaa-Pro dipeptidase
VSVLTPEGCRSRLARFSAALNEHRVDAAVLSNYRSIYYLSGHLRETELPQLLVVQPGAKPVLVTDSAPAAPFDGETLVYESYSVDWPVSFGAVTAKAAQALETALGRVRGTPRTVALEKDRLAAELFGTIARRWPSAEWPSAGALLAPLRRKKLEDEVALIAECVKCIEAGYAVARDVIRPGNTELDVFKEMHGEVVRRAGYNLKFEADFACGVRALKEGGTPLPRTLLPGDLYIIDIFPSFHGYNGDLCRTFAVSPPTDLQQKAWEISRRGLAIAEEMIRPGVRARDVWARVHEHIDSFDFVRGSFKHHAGHGIGLDSQEPPWLIPGSDHVFEAGDVVAIEPGCYSEALQGGVRLERDYVVREDGLLNLSEFPLDLTAPNKSAADKRR